MFVLVLHLKMEGTSLSMFLYAALYDRASKYYLENYIGTIS